MFAVEALMMLATEIDVHVTFGPDIVEAVNRDATLMFVIAPVAAVMLEALSKLPTTRFVEAVAFPAVKAVT